MPKIKNKKNESVTEYMLKYLGKAEAKSQKIPLDWSWQGEHKRKPELFLFPRQFH